MSAWCRSSGRLFHSFTPAAVIIVAVGSSHNARPRCGRTQLACFVGDQLTVGGQIGWSPAGQWQIEWPTWNPPVALTWCGRNVERPTPKRAAAFWTDCSRLMRPSAMKYVWRNLTKWGDGVNINVWRHLWTYIATWSGSVGLHLWSWDRRLIGVERDASSPLTRHIHGPLGPWRIARSWTTRLSVCGVCSAAGL